MCVCARCACLRSKPLAQPCAAPGGDETKREPASVSPFRPKFCVTGRLWAAWVTRRNFVVCRLTHAPLIFFFWSLLL